MRVLVTGGAGFIGSHFAKRLLAAGDDVRVLDALTYSGNPANLEGPGSSSIEGDICDATAVAQAAAGWDAIVNFAAETHVDRSILGATDFGRTEFFGTQVLLEEVRRSGARFVQVSTDEVYGDLAGGGSSVGDRPGQAVEPVQRREGRRRPAHPGVCADVRRQRLDHARLEHLRAEPVPGEADPADDDQRASRGSRCRSTATGSRFATGSGSRTTAPGSRRCCVRALRARSTTSAAATSSRTWRSSATSSAHRRRRVADPSRRGPRGTRPPLLARHDKLRGLGWEPLKRSRRGSRRRSPGISPTAAGGSRSSPASTRRTTRSSTPPRLASLLALLPRSSSSPRGEPVISLRLP